MTEQKKNSNQKKIPISELNYEQAISELEDIIKNLESAERTLDDSLFLYERGQSLAQRCIELLEKAELKIQQVSGDNLIPYKPNEIE